MTDENVCNMPEELRFELHVHNGEYYANMIAWNDTANKTELTPGMWTDTKELPSVLVENLIGVFKTIACYAEVEDEDC